ncbi:hypothetical protein KKC49_03010, partial [Patescibacteria group bacterium]|nr:hypothetical protein [Patescibacteria group bacterium]MCG2699947.1 hypothetical protein [Candidatus Parcubacteria bacterium]
EDIILPKSLSPYLFNEIITVFEGTTLTIEPGVIIKFRDLDTGIYINGTMKAIGTTDEPIIFTSIFDDEYGGDMDGTTQEPQPGYWSGLEFAKTSVNSELENIIVRYAGDVFGYYDFGSGIKIDRSSISLKNSIIQSNSNNGVRLINSSSIIDYVQILDHQWMNYSYSGGKGILIEGGSPTITNSSFARNYYAIYMMSWWDPDTGIEVLPIPYIDATNTFEDNNNDIWPLPLGP